MKYLTLILSSVVFIIVSCKAQVPIAKLNGDKVTLNARTYKVENDGKKYVFIKNTSNRLEDVKQVAPNLPSGLTTSYHVTIDKKLLTKICAEIISAERLRKMPQGVTDWLGIDLKYDTKGAPLEMSFVIRNTSLISAKIWSK
ncbi:hypothetical protein ACVWYG_002862 [Pedobacter sp. UYEF25]